MHPHLHGPRTLAAIAAFKFAKTALLIVLAILLFRLSRPEAGAEFAEWLGALPIATGHQFVSRAIHGMLGLEPHTIGLFGVVALIYAVLYAIEGYGLWENARWAKYLTVISTSLFIPFELWEIFKHVAPMKIVTLIINLLIVAYLIHLLRQEIAAEHAGAKSRAKSDKKVPS